ncbi:MAG: GntR family transcriptional regulator [Dehalococcoidia bacterium]
MVRPAKSGSREEAVYEALKRDILEHRYKAGEPLSEKSLAEVLGVSRTPVREALAKLHENGLITKVPRRGAFVNILSVKDIRDVFEVRMALEAMAAKLVAEVPSPGFITKLEQLERQLKRLQVRDDQGAAQASLKIGAKLHTLIIEESGNETLAGILHSLQNLIEIARQPIPSHQLRKNINADLLKLIAAIKGQDATLAERLMRLHLELVMDAILKGGA